MAMNRQERINREVRQALAAVHYIEAEQAKGHDVSRLAEKFEKSKACLTRHHRCHVCGEEVTALESVKAWELDRLGPVCRSRLMQIPEAS